MKEQVQLDGLLFTSDTEVLCVMNQIMDSFAISTQICSELDPALDAVTHRRLDAVIVDWDGIPDPTIVAMVSGQSETHALLVGANFMIHKPTNVEHARRCMRAAYGTMLQNRRRSARVPVEIPVVARVADLGEIQARISDLSIGGLALQCDQALPINREVLTQFSLPHTGVIHATGKVANADSSGRAGVRFSFIPEDDRNLLEGWLAVELAKLEKAEMPTDNAQIAEN
jgi:hypothetical protein